MICALGEKILQTGETLEAGCLKAISSQSPAFGGHPCSLRRGKNDTACPEVVSTEKISVPADRRSHALGGPASYAVLRTLPSRAIALPSSPSAHLRPGWSPLAQKRPVEQYRHPSLIAWKHKRSIEVVLTGIRAKNAPAECQDRNVSRFRVSHRGIEVQTKQWIKPESHHKKSCCYKNRPKSIRLIHPDTSRYSTANRDIERNQPDAKKATDRPAR